LGVNPLVQQQKQATSEALKVIISNLPLDVEEESVRVSPSLEILHLVACSDGVLTRFSTCFQELMTTTVGQVKVVELAYDNKGKSKGIATVIFRQKGSAQKAFEQCTSECSVFTLTAIKREWKAHNVGRRQQPDDRPELVGVSSWLNLFSEYDCLGANTKMLPSSSLRLAIGAETARMHGSAWQEHGQHGI
jgi:hypothetical protein